MMTVSVWQRSVPEQMLFTIGVVNLSTVVHVSGHSHVAVPTSFIRRLFAWGVPGQAVAGVSSGCTSRYSLKACVTWAWRT